MTSYSCSLTINEEEDGFSYSYSPAKHEWIESIDIVASCDDATQEKPPITKLSVQIWPIANDKGEMSESVRAKIKSLRGRANLARPGKRTGGFESLERALGKGQDPEFVDINVSEGPASNIEAILNDTHLALPDDMRAAFLEKLGELWKQVAPPEKNPGRGR